MKEGKVMIEQKQADFISSSFCAHAFDAPLTMCGLMRAVDVKASEIPLPSTRVFIVALLFYFLHQILHEDVHIVRFHAGILHWSFGAHLAVLA